MSLARYQSTPPAASGSFFPIRISYSNAATRISSWLVGGRSHDARVGAASQRASPSQTIERALGARLRRCAWPDRGRASAGPLLPRRISVVLLRLPLGDADPAP